MNNNKKGRFYKGIWFKSEEQYKDLLDALNTNDKDMVLDIMFEIFLAKGVDYD